MDQPPPGGENLPAMDMQPDQPEQLEHPDQPEQQEQRERTPQSPPGGGNLPAMEQQQEQQQQRGRTPQPPPGGENLPASEQQQRRRTHQPPRGGGNLSIVDQRHRGRTPQPPPGGGNLPIMDPQHQQRERTPHPQPPPGGENRPIMDPQQQRERTPQPSPGGGILSAIFTVLIAFISIVALILVFSMTDSTFSILHQVPEGHVGVYWKGGALLRTITDPGFHLKMPLITQFEPIQVTLQKDQVKDIPCGTKGGVMISFEKIEVVNRLHKDYVYDTLLNYGVQYDKTWIYDKIHHEINQFCSAQTLQQVYIDMFDQIDEKMKEAIQSDCTRYAPGIEIISVRVTKPTIPLSIKRNFEQMEEERTKVLIAIEKQKVAEKEAETQKKMALTEAEKNALVSKILMEQKLMEKDSARRQEEIENLMYIASQKSLADANYYKVMKEAEANKLKLTPEYLELRFIESIADNSKIFFGDKVPNMIFDQRLLGNFMKNVAREVDIETT